MMTSICNKCIHCLKATQMKPFLYEINCSEVGLITSRWKCDKFKAVDLNNYKSYLAPYKKAAEK